MIGRLRRAFRTYPKIFAHLGFLGEDQTGRSLWDIDDRQLLAVLYQHRGELLGRQAATTDRPVQPIR